MKRTRLDTCVHEAAHATVAERLRWATVFALRVNNDATGACYFSPDQTEDERGIRNDMAVSVAGRIAQAMAADRDWRRLDLVKVLKFEGLAKGQRCSYSDFVWRRAQLTGDPNPAAAIRWVETELPLAAELAAIILRRYWNDLRDLAATLAVDGIIVTEAGEAALEASAAA